MADQPPQTETQIEQTPADAESPENNPQPIMAERETPPEEVKEPQKVKSQKFHFHISKTMRVLILVLLITGVIGQIVVFSTVNQQAKQLESTKTIAEQQSTDQQALEQSLDKYAQEIEQLNKSFPAEEGLAEFVQIVSQHLSVFPEGKVQFDTNAPIVAASDTMPHLTVTITATAPYAQFNQFQKYLANSPYVFLPLDLKIAGNPQSEESVKIILKGRLYVNESLQ